MGQPDPRPLFTPTLEQAQGPSREADLLARIAQLEAAVAGTPAALISQAKSNFKVPAGEEGYVHALVTHKSGVAVPVPAVEPYHPAVYRRLASSDGFQAEIVHDPATAAKTAAQ